jgi:hypothetical protein
LAHVLVATCAEETHAGRALKSADDTEAELPKAIGHLLGTCGFVGITSEPIMNIAVPIHPT